MIGAARLSLAAAGNQALCGFDFKIPNGYSPVKGFGASVTMGEGGDMAKKGKSGGSKKIEENSQELFSQLATTARHSRTLLSRQLLSCGLYAGQDAVILALDADDGMSLSAIADQLGVRAPTMTKTINRLAAQGFVDKRGSDTDARLSHVFLTESGREAVDRVRKALRKSQRLAAEEMSSKDLKLLTKLLKKMERNIAAALQ